MTPGGRASLFWGRAQGPLLSPPECHRTHPARSLRLPEFTPTRWRRAPFRGARSSNWWIFKSGVGVARALLAPAAAPAALLALRYLAPRLRRSFPPSRGAGRRDEGAGTQDRTADRYRWPFLPAGPPPALALATVRVGAGRGAQGSGGSGWSWRRGCGCQLIPSPGLQVPVWSPAPPRSALSPQRPGGWSARGQSAGQRATFGSLRVAERLIGPRKGKGSLEPLPSNQCRSVPLRKELQTMASYSCSRDGLSSSPRRSFLLGVEANCLGSGKRDWTLMTEDPKAWSPSGGWKPHPGCCGWTSTENTGCAQRRQEGARTGGRGLKGGTHPPTHRWRPWKGLWRDRTGGRGLGKGYSRAWLWRRSISGSWTDTKIPVNVLWHRGLVPDLEDLTAGA